MPFATTQVPQAPDVPFSNGVPSVFRAPTKSVFTATLLIADVATVLRSFGPPEWGVFSEDGTPIIIPDSIIAVDVRREWNISTYQMERGAFQSYNKVELPGDIRVRMAVAGPFERAPFLQQLDHVAASLDLYTVITPDALYPSVNIIHYDYRREQRGGASLLQVDLWLQEVRVTAQTEFTNTKSPEGAANQAGGTVQGVDPTPAQAAAVTSPTVAASSIPTGAGLG